MKAPDPVQSAFHRVGIHAWQVRRTDDHDPTISRDACEVCGASREFWLGDRYVHYSTLRKAWDAGGNLITWGFGAPSRFHRKSPARAPAMVPPFIRMRPSGTLPAATHHAPIPIAAGGLIVLAPGDDSEKPTVIRLRRRPMTHD
jgi:hypothetical protein